MFHRSPRVVVQVTPEYDAVAWEVGLNGFEKANCRANIRDFEPRRVDCDVNVNEEDASVRWATPTSDLKPV
jgi:hypothetical protein